VDVVRLGARADRVRREALEEDQGGDDEQAEAEQSPMRRWAPDAAAPAGRAQGFFPCPSFLPGTVVVVAVVVVVVVVVVCLTWPGATADLPRVVVIVTVVFV
jgi:hypothetical protein